MLLVAALLIGAASHASAQPSVAPAAAKSAWDEPRFRGYTGQGWREDYGVRRGQCRIDEVVEARKLGTRVPTVLGPLLEDATAARIEAAIDAGDRACAGLVVELLDIGRVAYWQNPGTSIAFTVRPVRDLDRDCREFEFTASQRGRRSKSQVRACRDADARWTVIAG